MAESRWWRALSLVIMAVVWWGCAPAAQAGQKPREDCHADQLRSSVVEAEIRFEQRGRDYAMVYSDMTVEVPVKDWALARQLTFSDKSSEYRTAMRCLLRGGDNSKRDGEWRFRVPSVTARGGKVTVQYDALAPIRNYDPVQLGPWEIESAGKDRLRFTLQPPRTLQEVHWKKIRASLGGLNYNDRSELASSADENGLEWNNQLPQKIQVDVDLPWQRSFGLSLDRSFLSSAGIAAWWVCASFVIAWAAIRAQRAYPAAPLGAAKGYAQDKNQRVSDTDDRHSESIARTVLQWAVLSAAVAVTLILFIQRQVLPIRWRTIIFVAAGFALVLVARPWRRGVSPAVPQASGPAGAQRRQACAVMAFAAAAAGIGLLVVLAPELFGLPADFDPKATPTALGRFGLALMGLTTVWLWLVAMAAWAWRFAREGGLVPVSWSVKWDKGPVRWTATVAVMLAVVAGLLFVCLWLSNKRQWERVTWLTDQPDSTGHDRYISEFLAGFSFTDLLWIFAHSWVLTGIALFALLHFRIQTRRAQTDRNQERLSLAPEKPDRLLTVALFAFLVGQRIGSFAAAATPFAIWLLLSICSLFMVLSVGRWLSVLGQMGDRFYVQRLSTKKRRHELLGKAHQYRNVIRQLHLADQGHAGDITREQLEDQLHGLHQWLVAACGRNPPEQISVLDVALAWGPEGHWWSNGLYAARVAFCFGIPASVALVWLDLKDPWLWQKFLHEPTGIPDTVAKFIASQVAWATAGFVLGALWRLLPGRRSAVRAWSLTAGYALPALMAALLIRIIDADFGLLFLYLLFVLTVLTLTSIWMDTVTFKEERQFWPGRFALLLSIYQVRGVSGQVTWILVQVGAAVEIWHQLTRG
ncbi:DUF6185 family protein [Streptomyces sp. NPDC007264]|uniref:DUF6185 family protein n=1 Tax=Streptomyces sp. NPDC007264 TaxID=3364777 RepID=UPI0036DB9ABA